MGLLNLALWLVLVALAAPRRLADRLRGRLGLLLALVPLASGVLLTVYVFSEDDYRGGGISRWDAYGSPGGAAHALYVISFVACGVLAGVLLYAHEKSYASLFRTAGVTGGLALGVLTMVTFIGYSLN